ncbi:MAG: leucine-rich repeat domain-containing protein, partial [Clostridiales bacterium]|nr:leucine-rich repeat domain-containing protein [Clostridiales bacterium]
PNPKPKDTEYIQYFGDDNKPLARGTGKTWLMPGRNVTIRAEIKTIEAYGTATFTLPKGTKTIGENAFEGIKAEIVYVPDEVKSISAYAFANNTKLKQIRLPKDCVIDDAAFFGCTNLMAIYTSGDGKAKDWAKDNGYGVMTTK